MGFNEVAGVRNSPDKWVEQQLEPFWAVKHFDCEPGFSLMYVESQVDYAYVQACEFSGSERQLVMTFALAGESGFKDETGLHIRFRHGYTTITSYLKGRGERYQMAGSKVRQLRLIVSEIALRRFLGEEAGWKVLAPALGRSVGSCQLSYMPTVTSMHLRNLTDQRLLRQQSPLNLRIQALSLLAEHLCLLQSTTDNKGKLRQADLERIEQLDKFMREHLEQNLSVPGLCAIAGVSEYKLKEGFRQIFGVSPGQHLLDLRMHRALELLSSGLQVAQTAWQLGYQHPNNFSAAFNRYFGRMPKTIRSQQNYTVAKDAERACAAVT